LIPLLQFFGDPVFFLMDGFCFIQLYLMVLISGVFFSFGLHCFSQFCVMFMFIDSGLK
jgi:hypothetical protein